LFQPIIVHLLHCEISFMKLQCYHDNDRQYNQKDDGQVQVHSPKIVS